MGSHGLYFICLGNLLVCQVYFVSFADLFPVFPFFMIGLVGLFTFGFVYTQSKFMFQNQRLYSPFFSGFFSFPPPEREKPAKVRAKLTQLLPSAEQRKGKKGNKKKKDRKFRERNSVERRLWKAETRTPAVMMKSIKASRETHTLGVPRAWWTLYIACNAIVLFN